MTGLCFTKQRKTKNDFVEAVYSVLTNHKFLKQSLKLEKEIINCKNYYRQIHCPFKIFECNLERVKIYEGFYSKKNP